MRRSATTMLVAAVLVLGTAGPALAAVIERRSVSISISDTSYLREEQLLVNLTEQGDIEAWQRYPIWLDEHVELVSCTAEVLLAGKVVHKVPRRKHERIDSRGSGLYSSEWYSVIPFPPLAVGQQLRIEVSRRYQPLFPATTVPLLLDSEQQELRVHLRGGGAGLRWQLANITGEHPFVLSEQPGGLDLEATGIEALNEPDYGPPSDLANPVLRVAWGEYREWSDVGRWYSRLIGGGQGSAAELTSLAGSLCRDSESARASIEHLAGHVKTQVRYEAVEIGKGSWVPTPAREVLERGWGDCKDKSELLRRLLEAVDIPAYPVLIRGGRSGGIDPAFPWSGSFNHMIVAIPQEAAGATADDPVHDGYLFIDPTQDMGAVSWLTPSCQGRPALVIRDGAGILVHTPIRSENERRHLEVRGEMRAAGGLGINARLQLSGSRAVAWIRDARSKPRERTEEDVRDYFTLVFTGATGSEVGWQEISGDVPAFELSAELLVPNVGQGNPGRRSIRALGLAAIPEPRILDDRAVPVELALGEHSTEWRISLPADWCPAVPDEVSLDNQVGSFQQTVAMADEGTLHLQRRVVIRRNLVGVDELEMLSELAVAENRAISRRLRLRCSEEQPPPE